MTRKCSKCNCRDLAKDESNPSETLFRCEECSNIMIVDHTKQGDGGDEDD